MREDRYQRRTRTWRTPSGRTIRETRREWSSSGEQEDEERPSVVEDILGLPDNIRRRMGLPPRRRP